MNGLAFIPSPPFNGVHLGPFFFHMYGVMYVLAVAAAILIARHEWELRGGQREDVYEAAWWGFPAGLVGGRIYFLITTPSQIPPGTFGFLEIWKGGLGIWGGVAAGAAVGAWRLRRRMEWPALRQFMNVVAPCLLVAQAIGRVGNYFNQELFGTPSTLPWALKIDPQFRPPHYTQFATFQPSFLYEMIWDLALGAFLIWLGRRRVVRAPGIFALYVAGYSGYRIFEETIRIDYSEYILGERLNFWIALLIALAGLAWFGWAQWWSPRARRERAEGVPVGPPIVRPGRAGAGAGGEGQIAEGDDGQVAGGPGVRSRSAGGAP